MSAKLTFYGGAGSVTGANFLFDTGNAKILIDCGAYEQERTYDPESAKPFPYEVSAAGALVVTHAHQDHIGRIPKLMREGFRGTIYSTPPTKDLARIMLDDAFSVMAEEAASENRVPLFEKKDIDAAFARWKTVPYHEAFRIGDISLELLDAGHILGSAMVKLTRGGRSILFTGDLGNSPEPLLNETESPGGVSYLVMESVYGDRAHEERAQRRSVLKRALVDARQRGGVLLIPSFSLERTQVLLYELHEMFEKKELEPLPVFLDAPLAIRVTEVFERYPAYFNATVKAVLARGDDPFTFKRLALTEAARESRRIHDTPNPKIIIAGAGMSGGGRVRDHEKRYLGDPRASVLFVGYQAPGTLGRRIQEGQREVEVDRQRIAVRARISSLTGYSGHKDRDGLLEFVEKARTSLEKVFVVMGEPSAELYLAQRIRDFLDIPAVCPQLFEHAEIDL